MSKGGQQGPGSDEIALANIANQAFQRQTALYDPIIKKYSAMADDSASVRNKLAGTSNVSTQQAFSQAVPKAVSGTLARGGSVGNTMAGVEGGKDQAQAAGGAGSVSQAKNVQLSELNQVIGFGRGQATQATTGLGQAAETQSEQQLRNARLAAAQRVQIGSALSAGAGFAYGAFGPRPEAANTNPDWGKQISADALPPGMTYAQYQDALNASEPEGY